MPHIIILDENGNEIGREEHEPGGGGFAPEEDHEATKVIVNLGRVGELLGIKDKDKNA